jgi:DNA-binding Lrp family transcriptional regulator
MHGVEFRPEINITSNPRLERLRKLYADRSQAFSLELWDRSDTRFRIKSYMNCDDFTDDAPDASKCLDFMDAPDALKNIMCYVPDDSGDPLKDFEEAQRQTKSVAEVIARYSSIDGMSSDFILTILCTILLITTFSIQFDF